MKYICFTEYDVTIPNKEVAFKKVELKNTFGEYLAAHGMTQARIVETERSMRTSHSSSTAALRSRTLVRTVSL